MVARSSRGWPLPALVGFGLGVALGLVTGRSGGGVEAGLPGGEEAPWTMGERPAQGPEDAAVTIVEFTDYQCPFCRRWHQETYPELLETYGDRVRYVVRHLPIKNAHPFAEEMARAAVCAHRQDRFWDYHERLFQGPFEAPGEGVLEGHAHALGLDPSEFSTCLESEASLDVVSGDFVYGVGLGVRSTPSFWIEGRLLRGVQSIEALRGVLDPLLESQAGMGG